MTVGVGALQRGTGKTKQTQIRVRNKEVVHGR